MNILRPFPRVAAHIALLLFLFYGTGASASVELANIAKDRDLENLRFKNLDIFGTTATGRIHAITQSANGFIWIGTRQGAYRYDGYRIKPFHPRKDDPGSIAHDTIWTFHVDHKARLWIGTHSGLSRYVPETETFKNYLNVNSENGAPILNQINSIIHTVDGDVLASSEEGYVYRYVEAEDHFTRYNDANFGLIKCMTLDPSQRLWIGIDNAVVRYDPATGETKRFVGHLGSVDGVSRNYVNSILYVNDELIWAGTTHRGVVLLNSVTGGTTPVPYIDKREEFVNQIAEDENGNVWVASNAGIAIHMANSGEIVRHGYDPEDDFALPISGITAMFCDSQGNLWTGSNFDGVSISSRSKEFLKLPLHRIDTHIQQNGPISVVLKDRNENLWVGYTKSGVAVYPKDGGSVRRYLHDPNDPSSISSQPVLRAFEDSRGNLWFGTYRGGLYKFLPESQSFQRFVNDQNDPYSIAGHDIRSFAEDEKGNLWINTHGAGISYLDTATGRFSNFAEDSTETGFQPIDNWAFTICYDSGYNLWIGTSVGVSVFQTRTGTTRHYRPDPSKPGTLSNAYVSHIFEDSRQRIWLATNDGLNLYRPETDDFVSYDQSNGFPHGSIASIIEDDNGYIWTGTFDGLARFDPKTLQAKSYSASDGLASNEFFEGSAIKDIHGYLYFGQNKGITKFLPSEIEDNTLIPDVHITGFRVFDAPLPLDPNSTELGVLDRSILSAKEVRLKPEQNSISIRFTALNYIEPFANQYSYKLEGFDSDWSAPGVRRDVTYTNLNPGNYTFRVRGSNNDEYWNEIGDTLSIVIPPPYWQTLWFRAAALLVLIAIPTLFFLWRVNSMKAQKVKLEIAVHDRTRDLEIAHTQLESAYAQILAHHETLEETVKKRTEELEIAKGNAERSDKLKSAFLANMSHEIRTPMNAIMGFLHLLNNQSLRPEEREQFNNVIQRSSKSLLTLIDDILDLSTIEAGEAEIRLAPCNIGEICDELQAMFAESVAKESDKRVQLVFESDLPEPLASQAEFSVELDPLRLKQILWNLISNAVKFTDEGEIRFKYRVYGVPSQPLEKRLEFTVQDTGIGIPENQREQIFNRFHKLEKRGKRLYRGTGLGLTITKTLTELMEGSISVSSEEGRGTTFVVDFPYRPVSVPQEPSALDLHQTLELPNFSGFAVLVVEDEAPNFHYIKNVLAPTEATVHWATDGMQALEMYRALSIDLILLDLKLPQIDGYQVTREIRAENQDIPIIAQSAYAMRGDRDASIAAGATEHLAKPYTPSQLLGMISQHLPARS